MAIQSKNPATLEILQSFEELTADALVGKIALAQSAFENWKETTFEHRAELMFKLAEYLKQRKSEMAKLMTLEMGKTLAAGESEIEKCAITCEYYAENAEQFLSHEPIETTASESYAAFEPLGVVLAIMPWNFPFWQVFRFAAPAIMAGNVGLLKHASNVPQCAQSIEAAFTESGFPAGVFQNLLLSSSRVETVIRDPRIKAVTLTGSEKAGSQVAKIAGEEIKKTVLELGGSDPFIVLDDADVDLSCEVAASARMQNNVGQSCIAAKRFIVHEKVADHFVEGLVSIFKNLKVGNPLDPDVQIGPLATEQILLDVEEQVNKSIEMGAEPVFGGKRLSAEGYFYEPTILTNVTKGMPVYDEEVFGPVMAVIRVKDDQAAIQVANDTPYGLGASLFTQDIQKAKGLIPLIEAGNVFVNGQVKSDPRAPFGGIKKSGYGRELSHYGIKEFVNIKNVWIK